MSTQQNSSEEIDLGQLFKLIGDGFTKLFNFLNNIFKRFFHGLILFLQFIQKHFIKFAIASVIGIVLGGYWDYMSDPVYRSSMIVQPNFNSAQQLYNNIDFYNELAKEKAFKTLAASLKISDKEAATIKKIEIEAFSDNNQKIKQFSDFVTTLDSISRASLSYEEYLENFNNINAKFHKIELESIDAKIAKKCQNAIVRSIENNTYFSKQKSTNDINIALNETTVNYQIKQIDSLSKFYQQLKLIELQKPEGTSGTSINLASDTKSFDTQEITLLDKSKTLREQIEKINKRKADTENIINVISDFPDKGSLVNDLINKKIVLLPCLFLVFIFVMVIFFSLNRFLKTYKPIKE